MIKLTQTVKKGGCAAKLPAGELREVLSQLDLPRSEKLVVGTESLDDGCLWDLDDNRYMVQTLDFFTPMVDDPQDFGKIAAANAISDVYAMGGEPKIALTILAFPASELPLSLLAPMLGGAVSVIKEAGMVLGGGHTIDDETLKLGFSVTGFVAKDQAWTNAGACCGDQLILTKPLGTGTITSALKQGKASDEWVKAAVQSMTTLNRVLDCISGSDVHAATDITGFGLGGHSLQMAQASHKSFRILVDQLPVLEGAMECLERNILNRAHHTNANYVKNFATYDSGKKIAEPLYWLTVDPQTSGGLLLSVSKEKTDKVLSSLKDRFPQTQLIGEVIEKKEKDLYFL